MKTFAIFLLSKETFTIRTCSILESFFRKLLSKATFERKLANVSLALMKHQSVAEWVRFQSMWISSIKARNRCEPRIRFRYKLGKFGNDRTVFIE